MSQRKNDKTKSDISRFLEDQRESWSQRHQYQQQHLQPRGGRSTRSSTGQDSLGMAAQDWILPTSASSDTHASGNARNLKRTWGASHELSPKSRYHPSDASVAPSLASSSVSSNSMRSSTCYSQSSGQADYASTDASAYSGASTLETVDEISTKTNLLMSMPAELLRGNRQDSSIFRQTLPRASANTATPSTMSITTSVPNTMHMRASMDPVNSDILHHLRRQQPQQQQCWHHQEQHVHERQQQFHQQQTIMQQQQLYQQQRQQQQPMQLQEEPLRSSMFSTLGGTGITNVAAAVGTGLVGMASGMSTIQDSSTTRTTSQNEAKISPGLYASAPKNSLYTVYGKKHKQLSQENYIVWHNGAKPHELKFSAVFLCPMTGEIFTSGRYGDPQYYTTTTELTSDGKSCDVIWYTKKTAAEHGAASRAFDCISYREAQKLMKPNYTKIGEENPYLAEDGPSIPFHCIPPEILNKIQERQRNIILQNQNKFR